MKIGFLGNANNVPFMLARALLKLCHEVLFIVDRGPVLSWEKLNRPENAYSDITIPYPKWIYDASPLDLWQSPFYTPKRAKVVRMMQNCDAVVLNEFGVSLSGDIRRPAIALLTGTDLEVLADYAYLNHLGGSGQDKSISSLFKNIIWKLVYEPHYRRCITAQRDGIRAAIAVIYPARGFLPRGDALLDEIGVHDSQRISFTYMTDLEKNQLQPPPDNSTIRVLCMARLTWKKPKGDKITCEMDYKGSDIMIRGLGLFFRVTGIRLDIRLIKKGAHIPEIVQLLEEEGIADQVTWLEEMSHMAVLEENKAADIIFEQLGVGLVGLGCMDAMAIGRPVIANGRPDIMKRVFGEELPICHATNAEEVCAQLQRLVAFPEERKGVGIASHKYVKEKFAPEILAEECVKRLKKAL